MTFSGEGVTLLCFLGPVAPAQGPPPPTINSFTPSWSQKRVRFVNGIIFLIFKYYRETVTPFWAPFPWLKVLWLSCHSPPPVSAALHRRAVRMLTWAHMHCFLPAGGGAQKGKTSQPEYSFQPRMYFTIIFAKQLVIQKINHETLYLFLEGLLCLSEKFFWVTACAVSVFWNAHTIRLFVILCLAFMFFIASVIFTLNSSSAFPL